MVDEGIDLSAFIAGWQLRAAWNLEALLTNAGIA